MQIQQLQNRTRQQDVGAAQKAAGASSYSVQEEEHLLDITV